MYFDPKTKRFYGELEQITPEEEAFLDEQIRKGIMVSTEHPPQEVIDAVRAWNETHAFNEGLDELLKERGYPV